MEQQMSSITADAKRGIDWMRRFVDAHLSRVTQEVLGIAYATGGARPAAVYVCAGDRHFRLEPESDGRTWTLATDEAEPQILEVFTAAAGRFQDWLLVSLALHAR